jgi:hypothetical protein
LKNVFIAIFRTDDKTANTELLATATNARPERKKQEAALAAKLKQEMTVPKSEATESVGQINRYTIVGTFVDEVLTLLR